MLKALLLLIICTVGWILALWFALPLNFSGYALHGLVLLHVVPPLGISACIWGLESLFRSRTLKTLEARDAIDETQRQEALAALIQEKEAALARLPTFLECRATAFAGTGCEAPPSQEASIGIDDEASEIQAISAELQEFAIPLRKVLKNIYTTVPAAVVLPLYIVPPVHLRGIEVVALVRSYVAGHAANLDPPMLLSEEDVRVRYVPRNEGASDGAFQIFDGVPELPGALIIAMDSPAQRNKTANLTLATAEERIAAVESAQEQERRHGPPGLGVAALLLTTPVLPKMLANLENFCRRDGSPCDNWTPHQERAKAPRGEQVALGRLTPTERKNFGQQPVLAHIHRPAYCSLPPGSKPQEARVAIQRAMENALRAASKPSLDEAPVEYRHPRWVIHNAGPTGSGGQRLGALLTVIQHLGIDLHPFDETTNFAESQGDLGCTTPWAMLEEAVRMAAQIQTPVLVSAYDNENGIELSLVAPRESEPDQVTTNADLD